MRPSLPNPESDSLPLEDLLLELERLNLPEDQYVITSSAALAARGIRGAKDIDIIVSDTLWDSLADKYTVNEEPFKSIKITDTVEVLGPGSYFVDPSVATPDELLKDPEIIHGHPFVRLEELRRFKVLGNREKDIKDVELIDQYLAMN